MKEKKLSLKQKKMLIIAGIILAVLLVVILVIRAVTGKEAGTEKMCCMQIPSVC